jgi:hypothetical protein
MSMTMSISSAPAATAVAVSNALTSVADAPSGKPTTAQVSTSLPASCSRTNGVHSGLVHTEAKPYCLASAHRVAICFRDASGLSSVWST